MQESYSLNVCKCILQAGKLSQEEAIAIAEKLGLTSTPAIERTTSLSRAKQLYNFSILKWSKGGSVQRLILQVCVDLQLQHLKMALQCNS